MGNSGILLTEVLYRKETPDKNFLIVDAAMNDLGRPMLYGAYHHILPVKESSGAAKVFDVVGPICESGDFLAKDRQLFGIEEGEKLIVMSAGAYGYSMSSNYNCRLKVPEIMVKGDKFYVTRKRDSYPDLVKKDIIPDFLK